MNFNDFKEAWDKDEEQLQELSLDTAVLKKAHQPIDNIRKNMKRELYLQLFAIGILAFAPGWYQLSGKVTMGYFALYGLMVAVSGYYFYRFYLFFRKTHNYNANAKDSLYELYYEIRLNIEMYKSLTYLIFPLALVMGGLIGFSGKNNAVKQEPLFEQGNDWIILLFVAVAITLLVILLTNWWVKYYYGKHAREIWKILQELKE